MGRSVEHVSVMDSSPQFSLTSAFSPLPAPTEEGWREHPRYEVIKRIFARDGQYEPFPDAPLSESGAAAEEAQAAE